MPFARRLIALAALGVATAATPAMAVTGSSPMAVAAPSVRSPIANDTFYFALTDRYRDGSAANNTGGTTGAASVTGFDASSPGFYHGGDLVGLTGGCNPADTRDDGLARLKRLGFTAVWITPPFVNRTVQGDSAAYHGYWFLDITKPDAHVGTEAEFAAFMSCAHRLGIKVFLDVVVNHTADVISFRGGDNAYVPVEERPYRTAAGKAFDPFAFAKGTTFPTLSATRSFAKVPVVQPGFAAAKLPAVLNEVVRYHNRGDIDWGSCTGVCEMDGDFVGLDDLMTEDWTVVKALADAYGSWITRYGIDGFRIDTAKHVDPYFFGRWLPLIGQKARSAGKPGFTSFGEVWLTDSAQLSEQMLDRRLPSVLDFPYQDTVWQFAANRATGGSLAALFDADDMYTSSTTNAYGLTTFLGNHDMGRIGFFLASAGPVDDADLLARDLLAHDVLMLTRGVPVVYYGDEVGMTGSGDGKDKNARQDMFATKVAAWRTERRVGGAPIGTGSSFAEGTPIERRIASLTALRAAHPALASGAQITRVGEGPVFAASRIDGRQRREYVVAFNTGATPAAVTIPTSTPSSSWEPLLGGGLTTSAASGALRVLVPARGSIVMRAASVLPTPAKPSVTLSMEDDPATGAYLLTAAVPGADPASVSFAYRAKGTRTWELLGTDDSRPFRYFADPDRLGRGRAFDFAAVVTSTDGQVATSKSIRAALVPLY